MEYQNKNRIKKITRYILLGLATVLFARLSMTLYSNDLESWTKPQIRSAVVQVSKLLPQLEEDEQSVRNLYDNLEKRRSLVYQNNEEALESYRNSGKNAETIIKETLSWMNRVTMLGVGHEGHVVVVSKDDYTILAHPDKQFVGEAFSSIGYVDKNAIPDISQIDEGKISDKFHMFFPASFFKRNIDPEHFISAVNAGIYGTAVAYEDTYILCGTTLSDFIGSVIARALITTLFFFCAAWVFIRYIGFSLIRCEDERKTFRIKLTWVSSFAVVILLLAIWYYGAMRDVTGDISAMNGYARLAVNNSDTYALYRDELSEWLDVQYLNQCRLAADLVDNKEKEKITRKELAGYARELGIEYIYVFDKTGNTIVTNSPFDHLQIGDNEEDQLYEFRPLLDGREYVIQDPKEDELSGEEKQYIGVSLRDSEDRSDGFVLITVRPYLRDRLLTPINVQMVLDDLIIGLPDHALAVDKETLKITASTAAGYKNRNVEDLGVNTENLRENFNGSFAIDGDIYYVGVGETEDLYLIPLVGGTDNTNALFIAIKLAICSAVFFLLFILTALYGYKGGFTESEEPDTGASDEEKSAKEEKSDDTVDEEMEILRRLSGVDKVGEKYNFESRWKKNRAIPTEQQTPEMRAGGLVYFMLLIFSAALILYEVSLISLGITADRLGGFSYVLLGDWEKGVNMFSLSYCLFLLCVLNIFQELLNQILYRIAKVSTLENETILLLLRNGLKYTCALVFLYMGLAKFGIDTKTLLASAGILTLMVGLAAKDMISDIIAGLFIIFEGTYKIGDFVSVGNFSGTVEEIGLRYTKIVSFSQTKSFNNSSIKDLVNYNGDVAREILKLQVPHESDLLELEKLFERELPLMAEKIPGLVRPPKYQGVDSIESKCILISIALYCDPMSSGKARRAALREFKLLFDREKINIP